MNPHTAVLIFVTGPQTDQRVVLITNVVLVGRGSQADVRLEERHASRRQFQLTLTNDGWVFENLSRRRTCVNGKKYKAGRKIILDTGDVIGVGIKTEILFVAAGDDAEGALDAYRAEYPVGAAAATPAPGAQPDQKPSEPPPLPVWQPLVPVGDQPGGDERQPHAAEELAAEERKAKFKKYAMVFAVYLVVMLVGVIVLRRFRRKTDTVPGGDTRPLRLSKEEIADFIAQEFTKLRNPAKAREALLESERWLDSKENPGHLYRAVHNYKLAIAYGRLLTAVEERAFREARAQLVKRVRSKYDAAWKYEMADNYRDAKRFFEDLLEIIPYVHEYEDPIRKKIVQHLTFIMRRLKHRRKR